MVAARGFSAGRTGGDLLLPGRIGTEVQGGDAPLATKRLRTDPRADFSRPHGERRRGIGDPLRAWLRRPAHNLRLRSHALECWGPKAIPGGCTVADWPVSYDELRPWFDKVERIVGIGGDEDNVSIPTTSRTHCRPRARSAWANCSPRRRGAWGSSARVPSRDDHAGLPRLPGDDLYRLEQRLRLVDRDKWHPGLTSVREALATGNFDSAHPLPRDLASPGGRRRSSAGAWSTSTRWGGRRCSGPEP